MTPIARLEGALHDWMRRRARHVAREELDALIDELNDQFRDGEKGSGVGTEAPQIELDWDECYRFLAELA